MNPLAQLMFSHIAKTPEDYEALYPPRDLPPGAKVTRIAPSPTGYLHLGVLFGATVDRLAAGPPGNGGVFYFRLEDTDKKREVAGGADDILASLLAYGVTIDEGFTAPGTEQGDYGPYAQSRRAEIYHCYAKQLVEQGLAYPCFCSEEERAQARTSQEAQKLRTGYYGAFALCRNLPVEESMARIQAGEPYVVRLRAPGSEDRRIRFDDQIKGTIEMPENDEDLVLLKSDGIPTYHFAHAVDDHLMRTTHVIRGDEWIASTPKHLQLFALLGWKPPKYCHHATIMIEDAQTGGKRKLSKRKDPEAAMQYFTEQGYPAESVSEYLMTIVSSDFEQWRARNPGAPRSDFPFSLKKMSVSGALFDPVKLTDVSKGVISRMTAEQVAGAVTDWTQKFDPELYDLLIYSPDYTIGIFAIDREGSKPRKDIAKWSDVRDYVSYFFDEIYQPEMALPENIAPVDAAAILEAYTPLYDPEQDKQAWFETIKAMSPALGFCPEVKAYKADPAGWKGHAGDVSTVIRLAVTGRRNTPDLCSIMKLLGSEKVLARLKQAKESIK
ncbi:MAG: glutamate--tRNA ligase [Oscillospiraceae bacterium]|nr:glutamate--tRNA ligase [Oscillospiraceae bacterium]